MKYFLCIKHFFFWHKNQLLAEIHIWNNKFISLDSVILLDQFNIEYMILIIVVVYTIVVG